MTYWDTRHKIGPRNVLHGKPRERQVGLKRLSVGRPSPGAILSFLHSTPRDNVGGLTFRTPGLMWVLVHQVTHVAVNPIPFISTRFVTQARLQAYSSLTKGAPGHPIMCASWNFKEKRRMRSSHFSTGSLGGECLKYCSKYGLPNLMDSRLHMPNSYSLWAYKHDALKTTGSSVARLVAVFSSHRSPWTKQGLSSRPWAWRGSRSWGITPARISSNFSSYSGHRPLMSTSQRKKPSRSLAKNNAQLRSHSTSCGILPWQLGTWKPNCPVGEILVRWISATRAQTRSGSGSPWSMSRKSQRKKCLSGASSWNLPQLCDLGTNDGINL